jgi:hypothetical protein
MTERLLHFIWQFQYFNKNYLATTDGDTVQVIFPGKYNRDQGPDFAEAKIRIADNTWAGAVELHIHSSDWKKHHHHGDSNYNNVVLHVVWEDDGVTGNIPVLELKSRVPKILLQRYEYLMNAVSFIPCENAIHSIKDIVWKGWKDRLLAERLIRKSAMVEAYLEQSNYHWEEAFWWLLARNFGMKVNADAFEAVARSIPISILARHKSQLFQLEALLMGQAGLLRGKFSEEYPKLLQREHSFYNEKYNLQHTHEKTLFLRMRPGSFPTVRLAQLAMLLHDSTHLFSKIKEQHSIKNVKKWFDVTASGYWDHHYRFDELSVCRKKKPGAAMIDSLIINTVVPVLFAYGEFHGDNMLKQKALQWLEETTAERNSITAGFAKAGIDATSAFDSQALIELKNEYCNRKRCLDCAVGNAVLKQK